MQCSKRRCILCEAAFGELHTYVLIGRRTAAVGINTKLDHHSFRATGITAYLKNGGTLKKNRRNGKPCLDPHNTALRSPAR